MAPRKYIFQRGPSRSGNLYVLVALAIILILINVFSDALAPARRFLLDYVASFYQVVDIPQSFGEVGEERLQTREELLDELRRLRDENLILSGKSQTMATVLAENSRLRQLLNASQLLQNRVLITEVVGVPPNPLVHIVIVDRGQSDGVYEGQPVVDANGLVGQVIRAGEDSSEVLLITDRTHGLSVETVRSGVRVILEGIGDHNLMRLRDVSATTDVRVDDELVTSGIGGVFPGGYPVGRIVAVDEDDSSAFRRVDVQPAAQLEVSRHLLLLFETREELDDSPVPLDSTNG